MFTSYTNTNTRSIFSVCIYRHGPTADDRLYVVFEIVDFLICSFECLVNTLNTQTHTRRFVLELC